MKETGSVHVSGVDIRVVKDAFDDMPDVKIGIIDVCAKTFNIKLLFVTENKPAQEVVDELTDYIMDHPGTRWCHIEYNLFSEEKEATLTIGNPED